MCIRDRAAAVDFLTTSQAAEGGWSYGAGLDYAPYPRLAPPPFSLVAGILLLGLAAPAVLEVWP